ncbi:hypothetical protein BU204_11550 [Actinophytocola xanthii]|uniref:DNA primase/polymerase bifunctional N-terminal domain-containing protein n=1 Tax=Actinophytocola xanthii TaxID=1912961 RepID=A0A1Q8CSU6_9PSEU|nr:hypothetical protein BU204_11550 [Actinophytocola xanthii]
MTAALDAARRGWHVFPLRPGTKRPALHSLDRCPRTGVCAEAHAGWEQRATTDLDRIRAAWSARPFNVGIATGPSGLVVVDLDTPKSAEDLPTEGWTRSGIRDGHDTFAAVCEQAGQPVPWDTYAVRTARGGSHLYFAAPAGTALRNTEGEQGRGLGWKVDTRAHGGYVVAAGSTTPDGSYEIVEDREPAALPGWLAERLTPTPPPTVSATATVPADRLPSYVAAALRGEVEKVACAQPTQHSRVLFCSAVALGQLVGAGHLPPGTAEQHLTHAAQHMITGSCRCTEREVERTIRNGLRVGRSDPRTVPDRPSTPTQPSPRTALLDEQGAA